MPYVSAAQRGYFNANRSKMEAQGVSVDEWNHASKGKKLPAHSSKSERAHRAKKARRHKETIYGSPSASGTTPHLRN